MELVFDSVLPEDDFELVPPLSEPESEFELLSSAFVSIVRTVSFCPSEAVSPPQDAAKADIISAQAIIAIIFFVFINIPLLIIFCHFDNTPKQYKLQYPDYAQIVQNCAEFIIKAGRLFRADPP